MTKTPQEPKWRVTCLRPKRGKIVAYLLHGDGKQVHTSAHDVQGLEPLRRQAAFLNKKGYLLHHAAELTAGGLGEIRFSQDRLLCFPAIATNQRRAPHQDSPDYQRWQQLVDVATSGDEDNSEAAVTDTFHEFPDVLA